MENGNDAVADAAQSFLSGGNILTMVVSALLVAVAWGNQSQKVDDLRDEVASLRTQQMTPGAAAAIGEIKVFDRAMEARIINIENEMRNQRNELMAYLQRIETKLDDHDKPRSRYAP